LIDENQLIAPKPDVDYRNLSSQPTPEDFFLLSRVTGAMSVKQLCATSGLGRAKTLAAVARLLDVGLLHEVDANGKPKPKPKAAPAPKPQPASRPPDPEPFPRNETAGARIVETSEGEVFAGKSQPFGLVEPVNPRPAANREVPVDHPATHELFEPHTREGMSLNDEEDDLFMASSPAHRSRLDGSAPVHRESRESRPVTSPGGGRPAQSAPPGHETVAPKKAEPAATPTYSRFPADFASYQIEESAIVEGLDPQMQREIYFVYEHLEHIDFYELFDLDPDADRKAIRTAYFSLSKRFHPDKFFREEAVEVASMVEQIFMFVTKGHETLSKPKKRSEYDRALADLRQRVEKAADEEDRKREMAAELLERRALQLEEQGDLLRASGEFRKVAALRRDVHSLLRSANLLLRANQKLDDAAKLARAAMTELRDDPEPRLLLGQIYEKNGMLVEALSAFEEAMELAPGDASVRVHVERVRSQLG